MCGPNDTLPVCFMATDKIVPDRFPPPVPTAPLMQLSTKVEKMPDGKTPYYYLDVSWGGVSDPMGVNYVVLRGQGDHVGEKDLPFGVPAGNYAPINGDFDPFDVDAKWVFSASRPCVLDPNTGLPSCSEACNNPAAKCYIAAKGVLSMSGGPNTDANAEYAYLTANADRKYGDGYLLQVDVRRENGSTRGVDILFPFRGNGALADAQLRWSLGETSGSGISSVLYTGVMSGSTLDPAVAQSKPIDAYFAAGSFHQVLIYVKGRVARGFLDGRELWAIERDSVPGDGTYALSTPVFGLMVKRQTAVSFDNFLLMPFLNQSDGAADTYARDRSAPRSRVFTTATNLVSGPGSVTITMPTPGQGGDLYNLSSGEFRADRATAYWYMVMAVDGAGNTSNLVKNRGFENIDGWDIASSTYSNESTVVFEGSYSGVFSDLVTPIERLNTSANPLRGQRVAQRCGSALLELPPLGCGLADRRGRLLPDPAGRQLRQRGFARRARLAHSLCDPGLATEYGLLLRQDQSLRRLRRDRADALPRTPRREWLSRLHHVPRPSTSGRRARIAGRRRLQEYRSRMAHGRQPPAPPGAKAPGNFSAPATPRPLPDTGFTLGNTYRAYRTRACDVLGNCGDWQGRRGPARIRSNAKGRATPSRPSPPASTSAKRARPATVCAARKVVTAYRVRKSTPMPSSRPIRKSASATTMSAAASTSKNSTCSSAGTTAPTATPPNT